MSVGAGIAGPQAPSLLGQTVELDVGQVAHGGFCVARLAGRAVFVRHTLPGERVRALVTEERARYLRADAVEILTASPDRVQPPCPYAGPARCGGCDWQHASLAAQRRLKAAVVAEQLQRLAGLDRPVTVEEVAGTPDGLGWRTRVAFAVRRDGAVGLHRHRSGEIEPVERCLIAHPGVEAAGVEGRAWPDSVAVDVAASAGSGRRTVLVTPR
ncbi:MAG: TRAM domain-containing protein, partial [Actinomycetota bacterium]|nr:TRAM domain-containing protein [Actinomycetota bacterium]